MKIAPSGQFVENIIKEQHTEIVFILGVRKAESAARKRRIEGRELADRLLNRHETIKEAYVYPPIVSLSTDDVWDILMSNNRKNAWGGDNSQLIEFRCRQWRVPICRIFFQRRSAAVLWSV